jgi:hypothetical protein
MRNLYKKKIPKRSFHETALDVIRMSPEQFAQFQNVALQYQGKYVVHESIVRPSNKILPSTFETISELTHPSELAALIHMERSAHDDHSKEYHEGGGLFDATTSIFKSLWNTVGLGPEFDRWFSHFDYESQENKIDDERYAKIIQESYKEKGDRDDSLGDWKRDKEMGTDEFSVWVDEDDQEVHVSLRGTKLNKSDLLADVRILATNKSGNEDNVVEFLREVEDKYSDYKLDVSAHSLGGNTLINVFNGDHDLDYDRVNLFNPGLSPLADLSGARETVDNDKYHFYLNSGDIASNTFGSVLPSGRENVHWSRPKHSPLKNHSIGQWTSI